MMTGSQALALAQGYIGCDRSKFRSKYKAMTGVDFGASADWCCGFASCIVVGWAGATLPGLPSLWCPDARRAATNAGREVSIAQARPGDVVYFEWSGNDNADHVGIFESYSSGVLTTIDGNVSNRVGRRSRVKGRDYRKVWIVRPTYAKEQEEEVYGFAQVKNGSSGNAVKLCQAALNIRSGAGLLVDGACGPVTVSAIKRWQQKVGLYQDGICGAKTWPTLLGK